MLLLKILQQPPTALNRKSKFLTRIYEWFPRGLLGPTSEPLSSVLSPSQWTLSLLPESVQLLSLDLCAVCLPFLELSSKLQESRDFCLSYSLLCLHSEYSATQNIWWINKSPVGGTDTPGIYILFLERSRYLSLEGERNIGYIRP